MLSSVRLLCQSVNDPVERYRLLMADVYELAGLSRRISGREAAEHGATSARWQILSVIESEPATVPQIARRLGLTRQAVQRVANELLEGGHVRHLPEDREIRSPRIDATAAGRQLLADLWRANLARRGQMLLDAAIDGDDLDAARLTLRRLIEALREP
jgi:DNA-binding MarR family transcriptional regulator